jgi:hypothetical protein
MNGNVPSDGRAQLEALRRHGVDAVSFQAIKSAAHWGQDVAPHS